MLIVGGPLILARPATQRRYLQITEVFRAVWMKKRGRS
jgi:hypothetical protein